LNILGDYRLSSACNVARWGVGSGVFANLLVGDDGTTILQNFDYGASVDGFTPTGKPRYITAIAGGDTGSACFAAAISLETSNGVEISGLNAEEQSDISFLCTWKKPQVSGANNTPSALECYVYYDAMIVLEQNNIVKLIFFKPNNSIKAYNFYRFFKQL
jgi:hypothetical protein